MAIVTQSKRKHLPETLIPEFGSLLVSQQVYGTVNDDDKAGKQGLNFHNFKANLDMM